MAIKFSEDIVPLSSLKINPGKIVSQVTKTHRPVLVTSRGRGVAVVKSLKDYEEEEEQCAFMKAVVEGIMDLEKGYEISLGEVKKNLGMK